MVVEILVAEHQRVDALRQQLREGVRNELGAAPVAKTRGQPARQPDGGIQLAQRREIVLFETGQCGYRILHTFNGWERERIDGMLYRDGVRIRPGAILERCARFLADLGMAEPLEETTA